MTAIEINVPDIGVDEVGITEILVEVGDKVEAEQSLIIVEGDKASIEVPPPQTGIAKEIKASVGDKTETDKLIMIFDPADGTVAVAPARAEERREAAPAVAPAASAAKGVHVPDIGGDEVEVAEIMVKVGDAAAAGQSLITVEGDKTSMEVPVPFVGIAKEIKVNTGDKVSTGSLIMVFEVAGAASVAAPVQAAAPVAAAAPAASGSKEVNVPDIGGDEVEVTEMIVKVGDKIAVEQSPITVEGDKASMEVPAPSVGTVKEIKISTGDKAKIGSLIMVSEVEGAASAATPAQAAAPAPAAALALTQATAPTAKAEGKSEFVENDAYVHVTPLIRRLAREFGVSLAKMKGSGRKGRILREDAQVYVKDVTKRAEAAPVAAAGGDIPDMLPWPKVSFGKSGEIEEVELGRTQKIPGANPSRNWVMIPHVTHLDKTDIIDLEMFRKQQNAEVEKCKLDMKFTPVVFIVKAVAAALEQMPRFDSSLPEDSQCLTLKKYINTGVVVDTPNGLVAPVFKDVNEKSITELPRELTVISKKAHGGKLTADETQGGYFTISNIGGLGIAHFAPIVNVSEVTILGVSKSSMGPVWNGKELTPRPMIPISLSFNHRAIDGVDGVCSITIINNMLSDIRRLMM